MKRIAIACILVLMPLALVAGEPHPAAAVVHARGSFVALSVADLDASVAWYTQKLGLSVIERIGGDGAKVAILEGGGLVVELLQHDRAPARAESDVPQRGIFKGGVIVGDLDALVATLKQRGVDIAYGPFPARGKQRANVIVRDIEGNLLQFFGE